ncbi:unnamed protein product, partial [Hapterophycus canaliculatus]
DLGLLHGDDFEDIVTDMVCDSVFNVSECTRFQLTDMAENSELVKKLLSTNQEKQWGRPLERQQNRRVNPLPETIEAFEKSLSKNARKQRKRRRNKLYDSGESVKFIPCQTYSDIDSAYVNLLRLHNLRHVNSGGSDSFQTDRYREFHLAAMKQALDNKELRLMSLVIDGK